MDGRRKITTSRRIWASLVGGDVVRRDFAPDFHAEHAELFESVQAASLVNLGNARLRTLVLSGGDRVGLVHEFLECVDRLDEVILYDAHATRQGGGFALVCVLGVSKSAAQVGDVSPNHTWSEDATISALLTQLLGDATEKASNEESPAGRLNDDGAWIGFLCPARTIGRGTPNYLYGSLESFDIDVEETPGIIARVARFFAERGVWIRELHSSTCTVSEDGPRCRVAITVFPRDGQSLPCDDLLGALRAFLLEVRGTARVDVQVSAIEAPTDSQVFSGRPYNRDGDTTYSFAFVGSPNVGVVACVTGALAKLGLSIVGSLMSISGGNTVIHATLRHERAGEQDQDDLMRLLSENLKTTTPLPGPENGRLGRNEWHLSRNNHSRDDGRAITWEPAFKLIVEASQHDVLEHFKMLGQARLLVVRWVMEPSVGASSRSIIQVVGSAQDVRRFRLQNGNTYRWSRDGFAHRAVATRTPGKQIAETESESDYEVSSA